MILVFSWYIGISQAAYVMLNNDTRLDPNYIHGIDNTIVYNASRSPPMLELKIDSYVFGSILFSLNEINALNALITDQQIPSSSPFRLNTTSLRWLFPDLYTEYPDKLLSIFLSPAQTPLLTFDHVSGITISALLITNTSVLLDTPLPVIEIATNITFSAKAAIKNTVNGTLLVGKVSVLKVLDMELIWASVKMFNVSSLPSFINWIATSTIIPQINMALAKGMPLSVIGGMSFVNTDIIYGQNFMAVATDFAFNSEHLFEPAPNHIKVHTML